MEADVLAELAGCYSRHNSEVLSIPNGEYTGMECIPERQGVPHLDGLIMQRI